MILHFKGYGLFVPAILVGCFALVELVALEISGRVEDASWLLGSALVLAGVICWFLGRWLKGRGSLLQDLRKSRHVEPEECLRSFYWIKMEWWGPILLALGVLCLIPAGARQLSKSSESVSARTKANAGKPKSEPHGAASQSQPVQPETIPTPLPAGSGR